MALRPQHGPVGDRGGRGRRLLDLRLGAGRPASVDAADHVPGGDRPPCRPAALSRCHAGRPATDGAGGKLLPAHAGRQSRRSGRTGRSCSCTSIRCRPISTRSRSRDSRWRNSTSIAARSTNRDACASRTTVEGFIDNLTDARGCAGRAKAACRGHAAGRLAEPAGAVRRRSRRARSRRRVTAGAPARTSGHRHTARVVRRTCRPSNIHGTRLRRRAGASAFPISSREVPRMRATWRAGCASACPNVPLIAGFLERHSGRYAFSRQLRIDGVRFPRHQPAAGCQSGHRADEAVRL